jgi:hypothetical protein
MTYCTINIAQESRSRLHSPLQVGHSVYDIRWHTDAPMRARCGRKLDQLEVLGGLAVVPLFDRQDPEMAITAASTIWMSGGWIAKGPPATGTCQTIVT